jgi:hypothetical protein
MKNRSLLLLAALLCATLPASAAQTHSPLLANIQSNASNLINAAAAMVASGHPAQGAALYMQIADVASTSSTAEYLAFAASTYGKAAEAFSLANDPGNAAIAYGRQGDVYLKQTEAPLPRAGAATPTTPMATGRQTTGSSTVSGGTTLTRNTAIGAKFGAPGPRSCSSMNQPSKGAISPEQARAYVICGYEQDYQGGNEALYLIGQVKIQVSRGRPYEHVRDSLEQIDPHQLVYDIRGTSVTYQCVLPGGTLDAGHLCSRTVNANDEGKCYKTTFNEWRCTWGDLSAPMSTDTRLRVPAPKASDVE